MGVRRILKNLEGRVHGINYWLATKGVAEPAVAMAAATDAGYIEHVNFYADSVEHTLYRLSHKGSEAANRPNLKVVK